MANTNKVSTRIQNKHDLEVNWKKATGFIPLAGELIVYDKEIDAEGNTLTLPDGRTTAFAYERFKVGDGVTPVDDLDFALNDDTQIMSKENIISKLGYTPADAAVVYTDIDEIAASVYSKNEINELMANTLSEKSELITIDDIDEICGGSLEVANLDGNTLHITNAVATIEGSTLEVR